MNLLLPSSSYFVAVEGWVTPFMGARHESMIYRATIEGLNLGASEAPPCHIVDEDGEIVAHISYNGKVWKGAAWTTDSEIIYDPWMNEQ